MRNSNQALARRQETSTSEQVTRNFRLRVVADNDKTQVSAAPEMDDPNDIGLIKHEEHFVLEADTPFGSAIEHEREERRKLRENLGLTDRRLTSAERELIQLRKSNVARRTEIRTHGQHITALQKTVHLHDLTFKELHSVTLPWIDQSIQALQHDNAALHQRVVALEAWERRQRLVSASNLALPLSQPPIQHRQNDASWVAYACVITLACIGIGLAIALL